MTVRVTPNELRQIINTNISDDAVLFVHIETANRLVDDLLSGKLSESRLKDVESYLAAHLLSMRDQDAGQLTSKTIESTTAQYGGEFGLGLSMTRFGQIASVLDTTGRLSSLGKARGQFRVFGDNPV